MPLNNTCASFSKIGDKQSVTIAKINCCIRFNKDSFGKIENPIIYLGAVGQLPIRGLIIENALDKTISK